MLAEWTSEGWLRGSTGRPEEKRQHKSAVERCGWWGGSEPSDEKLKGEWSDDTDGFRSIRSGRSEDRPQKQIYEGARHWLIGAFHHGEGSGY
jgi:hypothetical protein